MNWSKMAPLALLLVIMGCDKPMNYTKIEWDKQKESYTEKVETEVTAEVSQALDRCIQESGDIKRSTVRVEFPRQTTECAWNRDGNLGKVNFSLQARFEQFPAGHISLPKAAETLCGLKFNFPKQNIIFDDEILLTYNNYVLFSSQNFSNPVERTGVYRLSKDTFGLVKYDWDRLVETEYEYHNKKEYCLGMDDDPKGESICEIPETDTWGEFQLQIPTQKTLELFSLSSVALEKGGDVDLKFIILGDNNTKDCKHSGLYFDMTFEYLE